MLLRRVFARLAAAGHWFFLLQCLREEAAFDDAERSAILDGAAEVLLEQSPSNWRESEILIRSVERFSVRHGKATREWRQRRLSFALGEKLRSTVALSLGQPTEIEEFLSRRSDQEVANGDLLGIWPIKGL